MDPKQILNLLEQQQIPHTVRRHPPICTVAEGLALDLPQIEAVAKSIFITDDKLQSFYLAVLPLGKRLDLKRLRLSLNTRRLTLAPAAKLSELLGAAPGAVTPLDLIGNTNKIAVIFDAELQNHTLAVPLNSNTQTVWLDCARLHALLSRYGYEIQYLEL